MKAKKILIPYTYNPNWIGGTYYIQNLLKSIGLSNTAQNYKFFIYTDKKAFEELQKVIDIELHFVKYGLLQKIYNKIYKKILRTDKSFLYNKFDLVFPYNLSRMQQLSDKRVCWVPDLQEKYYPEFFDGSELKSRLQTHQKMIATEENIIFSSQSAQSDFEHFYPESTLNKFILNFAVFFDHSELPEKSHLCEKYEIHKKYFICSNQFWTHKNHKVLLSAISLLTELPDFEFVFTGKENDYRNPTFFAELKKMIIELKIETRVKFLGFIARSDQLGLMKHAHAVIQPSLFEGWSTVVEDAKSLSKNILCSDLDVHKEQLLEKGNYFVKASPEDLAKNIELLANQAEKTVDYNYLSLQRKFAEDFIHIVDSVVSH